VSLKTPVPTQSRKIAVYEIAVTGKEGVLFPSFTGTVYIIGHKNYT
jgi:acyl-coenzyme A thioesterase PaaI-like protein